MKEKPLHEKRMNDIYDRVFYGYGYIDTVNTKRAIDRVKEANKQWVISIIKELRRRAKILRKRNHIVLHNDKQGAKELEYCCYFLINRAEITEDDLNG